MKPKRLSGQPPRWAEEDLTEGLSLGRLVHDAGDLSLLMGDFLMAGFLVGNVQSALKKNTICNAAPPRNLKPLSSATSYLLLTRIASSISHFHGRSVGQ